MSEDDYDNDPEILAIKRRKLRARLLEEANVAIPGRRHGEVAYLRNAAKHIDLALTEYDKLVEPPPIAHTFAAAYDEIIGRLTAIGKEEAEAAAKAAAANQAAPAKGQGNRKGGASPTAPLE